MSELTKTNEVGLQEFNKLKSSIDEQVKNLSAIKVTDETSMAVANQQLSKAKQLDKEIDNRHALVKEEALRFCQAADLAKRTLKTPLSEAMKLAEGGILAYDKAQEEKKQAELKKLAEEKAQAEKEAIENNARLVNQMQEFEARAFKLIVDATTPADLSFVFTNYVLAFPPSYDVNIVERIKKLGKAKLNVVQNPGSAFEETYLFMRDEYLGVKHEIVAPIVMPSFDAVEQKIAVIQNDAPTNIKKSWTFEIMNLTEVPLEFLMVDESKVKAYIKENSNKLVDGMIENGIKFYQESKVKIK